jgi:hypothetical protein
MVLHPLIGHIDPSPVESLNDRSSSSYGLPQQVDTPPLNDNTLSMDLSGKQLLTTPSDDSSFILTSSTIANYMSLDSYSKEDYDENDFPALADSPESIREISGTATSSAGIDSTHFHSLTTSPVQQDESSQSELAAQAHQNTSAEARWCEICDKWFSTTGTRNRHIDDSHSEPVGCPVCGRMIVGKRKLQAHMDRDHRDVI